MDKILLCLFARVNNEAVDHAPTSSYLTSNATTITMRTTCSIFLDVSDWGEERITPFKIRPRGGGGDCIGGKGIPGHLHSFAFPSGMSKEEVKQNNIEESTLFIPIPVAMMVAPPELR